MQTLLRPQIAFGQRGGFRQANLMGTLITEFSMMTPILIQEITYFKIKVFSYLFTCTGITYKTVAPDQWTWTAVANSGTPRAAKLDEMEVKLWKAPSTANWSQFTYTHYMLTGAPVVQGPAISDGGWNVVPLQPTLTDGQGIVWIGDPAWKDSTGQYGTLLPLPDGWYRITSVHKATGFATGKRFEVLNQKINGYSPIVVLDSARGIAPIPPTFQQAGMQQRRIPSLVWPGRGRRVS